MKGFSSGDPRAVAAGRRGGRCSGAARLEQLGRRLARVCGLITPDAVALVREVYASGYRAGWVARKRAETRTA